VGIHEADNFDQLEVLDTRIEVTGAGGADYGIRGYATSGVVAVENSRIITSTSGQKYAYEQGTSFRAVASELDGAVNNVSGDNKCVGAYKADYTPLSATCG